MGDGNDRRMCSWSDGRYTEKGRPPGALPPDMCHRRRSPLQYISGPRSTIKIWWWPGTGVVAGVGCRALLGSEEDRPRRFPIRSLSGGIAGRRPGSRRISLRLTTSPDFFARIGVAPPRMLHMQDPSGSGENTFATLPPPWKCFGVPGYDPDPRICGSVSTY